MIVATIRARLTPQVDDDYLRLARRMSEIVAGMPGYVSHKGYRAEDGEHLVLAIFESEEALRAWSAHPEHRDAKRLGRERYYSQYDIQVCKVLRESKFSQPAQ